jgi:hypothetical protein
MWMSSLQWCRIVATFALLFLFVAAAFAADASVLSVPAGQDVEVAKSDKESFQWDNPRAGELWVRSTKVKEQTLQQLMFRAPPSAESKPIEVTYRIGTQPGKATITVTGGAPVKVTRVVLPGTLTLLDQSPEPITIDKAPTIGIASVTTGPDKRSQLWYLASTASDPQARMQVREEVEYHKGDEPRERAVVLVSDNPWGSGYEAAFKALFAAFVLAVIIEWGLAVIFNNRWYVLKAGGKGLKSLVTFLVAFVLVNAFDVDIVKELINALRNATFESGFWTKFLSALVLAGGSAGVNSMMVALGFRAVRTAETVTGKPPATKAWLAVKVSWSSATSVTHALNVYIKRGTGNYGLLATLQDVPEDGQKKFWVIDADPARFPQYGGFVLEPGLEFQVWLLAVDKEGKAVLDDRATVINLPSAPAAANVAPKPLERVWGPYVPAAGAIIDIEDKM